MIRTLLFPAFFALATACSAQTVYKITDVTVTEKEVARNGQDATAVIRGAEGSDKVVILAAQGIMLSTRVKISTQNVARSSLKSSAVNARFDIDLEVDGRKDHRRVEKVYYMDQERRSHFKESFTFKNGNQVRVIRVEFDGSLE